MRSKPASALVTALRRFGLVDSVGEGGVVADFEAVLIEAVAKICELAVELVQPESRLEDLGVDSLAVAEVIVEVEIRLGCELPIDVLRRLSYVETIGDVARELGQFGLEA